MERKRKNKKNIYKKRNIKCQRNENEKMSRKLYNNKKKDNLGEIFLDRSTGAKGRAVE